jgi:drug/metabolite transporter (DMT)-like permease
METPEAVKTLHRYFIIAALLQIVWGFVPAASKYVIDEIPIELYITIRWTLSGAIILGYLFLSRAWQALALKDALAVSCFGIMGYGIGSFGTLYGLQLGGVVNFALLGALSPVVTSLVAIIFLHERPRRLFWLALAVVVVGLALLVIGKQRVSAWSVAGWSALLVLGAFVLEGLVFVYSKRFKSRVNLAQYLAISQLSAAGFMWVLQGAVFHQYPALSSNLTIRGFSAILFVSIVACVLCYAVLYWLLNHIEGHRLALFDGLHTLSATAFGVVLFAEPTPPLMLLGGGLMLAGVVMGSVAPPTPRKSVEGCGT